MLKASGEFEVFYDGAGHSVDPFGHAATFSDPVAIAVHPNGSVYVLDRGDQALYHIRSALGRDDYSGVYTLVAPESGETFVFNRFGLHLSTLDLDTGAAKFNFTYSGHALHGKLLSVAAGRQRVLVNVQRDFHGRVELLQTAGDLSVRVKLNSFGNMRSLVTGDGRQYTFKYLSNTGLVTESVDAGGKEMLFSYNDNGKVNKVSWLGD